MLLVEDEEPVRTLARHVLQRCGYTVLEATNGRDAIKLVVSYEGPLHLAVSDLVIPHLGRATGRTSNGTTAGIEGVVLVWRHARCGGQARCL